MATNQINVCMLKTMPDEMLLIEKNASRSRHYDGKFDDTPRIYPKQ